MKRLLATVLVALTVCSCDVPSKLPTSPSLTAVPADASSTPAVPAPSPLPAPGPVPGPAQVFLLESKVISATASNSLFGYRVSISITFENNGSQDELLAYQQNSGALIDSQALTWLHVSISGIPMTSNQPPRRDEFARLPVGGRQVMILNFETYGDVSRASVPTTASISMLCWRLRGDLAERFSVRFSQVPIGR